MFGLSKIQLGIILALGAGLAATGGVVWLQAARLEAAAAREALVTRERDEAVRVAAQNAAALAALQADTDRQLRIANEERDAAQQRARRATSLRQEANRAPSSDDAAMPPVYRRALDGLRPGRTAGPDRGPVRPPEGRP